jgi:hypothetical protein
MDLLRKGRARMGFATSSIIPGDKSTPTAFAPIRELQRQQSPVRLLHPENRCILKSNFVEKRPHNDRCNRHEESREVVVAKLWRR